MEYSSGPWILNLYYTSNYSVEDDGSINTFNNVADGRVAVTERYTYEQFVSALYNVLKWDTEAVTLEQSSLIYINTGSGKKELLELDSRTMQYVFMFPPYSELDVYLQFKQLSRPERTLRFEDNSGGVNSTYEVGGSSSGFYSNAGHESDDDDDEDGDYSESRFGSDGSDVHGYLSPETDDMCDGDNDSDEDQTLAKVGRHVYATMGPFNPNNIDRDVSGIPLWDKVVDNIRRGTCFRTKKQAIEVITAWNTKRHREFIVKESTRTTWRVVCKVGFEGTEMEVCRWAARVTLWNHGFWKLSKWEEEHMCTANSNDSRNVTSKCIAGLIESKVKVNPHYPVKAIIVDVKQAYGVDVRRKKAWHGRRKALETIYGSWETNVQELPRFFAALKQSNPGTVVDWKFGNGSTQSQRTFKFVFWAFGPCVELFHKSPPVISIDGTHLRGVYKGKLLIAVVQTANKRIVPVAYALVDEESKESWTFFLESLKVHILKNRTVCVISDRHQGIFAAIEDSAIWKRGNVAHHRACLQYLRSNLLTHHKGKRVGWLCWQLGEKTTEEKFMKLWEDLCSTSEGASEYLCALNPQMWTLAFDDHHRWGVLSTNASESYNNVLKGTRFLPIRALVEATFGKTVALFLEEQKNAAEHNGHIPPYRLDLWRKYEERSYGHEVVQFDRARNKWRVVTGSHVGGSSRREHTVTYKKKQCTCRKWQEFRMPCSHAMKVARELHDNPASLCDEMLTTKGWRRQFQTENGFNPVPDVSLWPRVDWTLDLNLDRIVLYNRLGRHRTARLRMSMDFQRMQRANNQCHHCGSGAHTDGRCPITHPRTDRTRRRD